MIELLCDDSNKHYIPLNNQHSFLEPPYGRVESTWMDENNGIKKLCFKAIVYEEGDNLEELRGEKSKCNFFNFPEDCRELAITKSALTPNNMELFDKLDKILDADRAEVVAQKSLDPLTAFILVALINVAIPVNAGFFQAMGADIYQGLKDAFQNWVDNRKNHVEEEWLAVRTVTRTITISGFVIEIELIIQSHSESNYEFLLGEAMRVPAQFLEDHEENLIEKGINKLTFELKNNDCEFLFAVSSDLIPFYLDADTGQLKYRTPLENYDGGIDGWLGEIGFPGMSIAAPESYYENVD